MVSQTRTAEDLEPSTPRPRWGGSPRAWTSADRIWSGPAAQVVLLAVLSLAGQSCGPGRGTIGAVLGQAPDGTLTVREAPPGLAASRAGLQPDDVILLINGRDVRILSSAQIHEALSGSVGEPVNLTVERGDQVLRVTVQRTPPPKRTPTR